jgi:D-3-phosphoglycerate dehydrogenase
MRKSSIILNTARGGIINEDDLFEALQSDEIAGAGIDVWTVEPPTKDMHGRFFGLKNCIALPHLGGSTEEAQRLGCMGAVDIVSEYLSGKGAARNRVY